MYVTTMFRVISQKFYHISLDLQRVIVVQNFGRMTLLNVMNVYDTVMLIFGC